MTSFQQALLAIEIAVDALHESRTDSARDALDQIGKLGFDTRPTDERKSSPAKPLAARVRKTKQPSLFRVQSRCRAAGAASHHEFLPRCTSRRAPRVWYRIHPCGTEFEDLDADPCSNVHQRQSTAVVLQRVHPGDRDVLERGGSLKPETLRDYVGLQGSLL
jgi:hypothetical protein